MAYDSTSVYIFLLHFQHLNQISDCGLVPTTLVNGCLSLLCFIGLENILYFRLMLFSSFFSEDYSIGRSKCIFVNVFSNVYLKSN